MRLSRDEIEKLATTFKTPNWQHPPKVALCAFASLLAGEALTEVFGESFTREARTVWILTGITDASLIRVRASSARDGWSLHEPGSEDQQRNEDLAATRWPLAALRSLNVVHVQDATFPGDSAYEWSADWCVTMRDGETIRLPSSDALLNPADRERIESLIAVIRQHI